MSRLVTYTYVRHFSHGSSLCHVDCRPKSELALWTDIVTHPAETNDAAMTLTSIAKTVAASPRSCALTESKSSDTDVEYEVSPTWPDKISFSNRLSDSGVFMLFANRTVVRTTARTSSKSPNSVMPTIADEIGEPSFTARDSALSIICAVDRIGVLDFIGDPISFLFSSR